MTTNKLKPIKRLTYQNAEILKFDNTRVELFSTPTNEYILQFKILSNDHAIRAYHEVKKEKIVITGMKLSQEAAVSLLVALQAQLQKDGITQEYTPNP